MSAAKSSPKSERRRRGKATPPAGDGSATVPAAGAGRAMVWTFMLAAAPGLVLLLPLFELRPSQFNLIAGCWCLLTGLGCLALAWRGRAHRRLLGVYGAILLLAGVFWLLLLIQPNP